MGGNFTSDGDCLATWKSASKPGAVTAASLFRAALAAGWQDSTEKPRTERTPPRQKEPEQPKASKNPRCMTR